MTDTSLSVVIRFLFRRFADHHNHKSGFLLFSYLLFLILPVVLVDGSPHRSRNKGRDGPQLVYDQKQTGDYNIQVHLKDFQIIALLGDDVLGEYDYNYDYADFTVKPSSGPTSTSTTPKPTSTTRLPPTTAKLPSSTTELLSNPSNAAKPAVESSHSNPTSTIMMSNSHPYPIEIVQTAKDPVDVENKSKVKDSEKPSENSDHSLNEILRSTSTSNSQASSNNPPSTSPLPPIPSSTSESITPGKIKVQILEAPALTEIVASAPLGIVPGEDAQAAADGGVLHGELTSYRKCAAGFSRDKRGRCRRVRRPGVTAQLPFGFGRIASNLATRLRLPNPDKSADTSNSSSI